MKEEFLIKNSSTLRNAREDGKIIKYVSNGIRRLFSSAIEAGKCVDNFAVLSSPPGVQSFAQAFLSDTQSDLK